MNAETNEPKPVAFWARMLAWAIVVSGCVAAIGALLELSNADLRTLPWQRIGIFVLACAWVMPLFFIVALTGRAPRHWPGLGTHLWQWQKHGDDTGHDLDRRA